MIGWDPLDDELDLWRVAGRRATLWCRDDDACRDSPSLRRLGEIAQAARVPITLAAIPALLEPDLVAALARFDLATIVQHGWAHRDHAPAGERKRELRGDRSVEATLADLERGREMLRSRFGDRFAAILVPPWNRIDADVVAQLPGAGFHGLSTLGPRTAVSPVAGIVQANAHVDLIAWRDDRAFIGAAAAIARLADHLRARREGGADGAEPTGILTHHLDMSAAGWQFLAELIARTLARGAEWLDTGEVFGAPAPVQVTCARSA